MNLTPIGPLNNWKQLKLKPQRNVAQQVKFPRIVVVVVVVKPH